LTPTEDQAAPAIRLLLDLSTTHLPPEILADLNGCDGVNAGRLDCGWLLWVPTDPVEHASDYDAYDGVPASVLAIQRYARDHGCDFILLDCDAPVSPDLRTYQH
jgi:hypothetical protein